MHELHELHELNEIAAEPRYGVSHLGAVVGCW
jgi:hypothetical protein